ncbi:MAG: hypoxanthine phosphoribosyltransferase [Planctomycetes bacterium]|nr:hypoxanthine phosphoribosyltransferase [Planctomycetota bacterium]
MYTLITASQIAQRIAELGTSISDAYRGRPLTVLGVLNGSVIFVADLMRSIGIPHRVGFVQASSYRGETTSAGELTVATGLMPDIAGRDVLLVDDIFDTGRTVERLLNEIHKARPASLKTAVLLWKDGRSQVALTPDYHGFRIPNEFVVGYGLDYDDDYRHLPMIGVLEPHDLGQ